MTHAAPHIITQAVWEREREREREREKKEESERQESGLTYNYPDPVLGPLIHDKAKPFDFTII